MCVMFGRVDIELVPIILFPVFDGKILQSRALTGNKIREVVRVSTQEIALDIGHERFE